MCLSVFSNNGLSAEASFAKFGIYIIRCCNELIKLFSCLLFRGGGSLAITSVFRFSGSGSSSAWLYLSHGVLFNFPRVCLTEWIGYSPMAYSLAVFGDLVSASSSSALFSFVICAVSMSRTHSSSLLPESAHAANSTESAWNCSKDSFSRCFRQMKLYLSKAIDRGLTKLSSNIWINCLIDIVCISVPEHFVVAAFGLLLLNSGRYNFLQLHLLWPMRNC